MALHSRPVTRLRHQLRLYTWIALLAMLGLALAPSISHALNADRASNAWTQICSASGSSEPPRSAAMQLEHCGLCVVAAHALGMPPAPVAVVSVPEGIAFVAALFLQAPHPLFAWRPPQARAPPSFS